MIPEHTAQRATGANDSARQEKGRAGHRQRRCPEVQTLRNRGNGQRGGHGKKRNIAEGTQDCGGAPRFLEERDEYRGYIGIAECWGHWGDGSCTWFGSARGADGTVVFFFHGSTPEEAFKVFRHELDMLMEGREEAGVETCAGARKAPAGEGGRQ